MLCCAWLGSLMDIPWYDATHPSRLQLMESTPDAWGTLETRGNWSHNDKLKIAQEERGYVVQSPAVSEPHSPVKHASPTPATSTRGPACRPAFRRRDDSDEGGVAEFSTRTRPAPKNKLNQKAIVIQRLVRARQQRLHFLETKMACVRVQTAARGAITRRWGRQRKVIKKAKAHIRLDFSVALRARQHWKNAGVKTAKALAVSSMLKTVTVEAEAAREKAAAESGVNLAAFRASRRFKLSMLKVRSHNSVRPKHTLAWCTGRHYRA